MASDADIISHSEDTTLGLTPYGRTVKSVRRWPAVPVADLLRLRHVVDRRAETGRSAAAQELLHLPGSGLAPPCCPKDVAAGRGGPKQGGPPPWVGSSGWEDRHTCWVGWTGCNRQPRVRSWPVLARPVGRQHYRVRDVRAGSLPSRAMVRCRGFRR
jgi:hypothetical protein